MGITGLLPFIEKASRRTNINEFSGCTVAIDSYCWLHKGAFACADRIVRGEETDVHIKYCLKYVTMLLSKNIKPILVFDGRHLPAKAMTESKRRESRQISKKRAAELLSLGKVEEARSYIRRSVDITHAMALALIQECRKRNVDCIVAPYEADAQLAYLNVKNIAQLVITEDSDLILFGCTKVFFKMDLTGTGTLVETIKLPLVMKCPIESYTFNKFRRMCIMSGCDYLPSLPGVGLAKARQFVTASHDPDFANALKKLPSYLNRPSLTVTDEYRESFLKAEATFKHQYVYDPLERRMVRLTEPDDEDVEHALCVNAGEMLDPNTAFQLALGNLDPFTLKKMDDWHPDTHTIHTQKNGRVKTNGWTEQAMSPHPSIWLPEFKQHIDKTCPWQKETKKPNPIISQSVTRPRKKIVNLIVPETQDESLSIQTLSNMYCVEPSTKRQKVEENTEKVPLTDDEIVRHIANKDRSPILENKKRSFIKCLQNGNNSILKRLSRFPRTVLDENVVESKFFPTSNVSEDKSMEIIDESPERSVKNPFKVSPENKKVKLEITQDPFKICSNEDESNCKGSRNSGGVLEIDLEKFKKINKNTCDQVELIEIDDEGLDMDLNNSQKENSPCNSPTKKSSSPILSPWIKNPFRCDRSDKLSTSLSEDSVVENTYPMETLITPVDSQESFGRSPPNHSLARSQPLISKPWVKKSTCRVPGLKRTSSLPNNQPTLLSKFGFQKKPVMKR